MGISLCIFFFLFSLKDYYSNFQKGENWREAARIIKQQNSDNNPILLTEPITIFPFNYYYGNKQSITVVNIAQYQDGLTKAFEKSRSNWFLFARISDRVGERNKQVVDYLKLSYRKLFTATTTNIDIYLFSK